jgi:hypothetical protein
VSITAKLESKKDFGIGIQTRATQGKRSWKK